MKSTKLSPLLLHQESQNKADKTVRSVVVECEVWEPGGPANTVSVRLYWYLYIYNNLWIFKVWSSYHKKCSKNSWEAAETVLPAFLLVSTCRPREYWFAARKYFVVGSETGNVESIKNKILTIDLTCTEAKSGV